jgi:hypothetical protein
MNAKPLRFHQLVYTPNGPGLVTGRLVKPGEPDRILVSHDPADVSDEAKQAGKWRGGPTVLLAYLPEQINQQAER